MRSLKYSALILVALMLGSCHKIVQLPDTPYIKFTSFAVFDTTDLLGNEYKGGRLKFYFEDGDGDLGLNDPETSGDTDSLNLFFTLYRKTNGIMTEVPDNDKMKPSYYRIPYLERTGQNKILKGTIAVNFFYTFYAIRDSDIFKYRFYIKDRAQNYSDTVFTCEIPLSVNNVYTE
jgi:hypothetical protein